MSGVSSGEVKVKAGSGMLGKSLGRRERSESRLLGQRGWNYEMGGFVIVWKVRLADRSDLSIDLWTLNFGTSSNHIPLS